MFISSGLVDRTEVRFFGLWDLLLGKFSRQYPRYANVASKSYGQGPLRWEGAVMIQCPVASWCSGETLISRILVGMIFSLDLFI